MTLGNIVGGAVLVGLTNWKIYQIPHEKEQKTKLNFALPQKMNLALESTMLNTELTVEKIMNDAPLSFDQEMLVSEAVDRLLEEGISGSACLER